MEKLEKMDARNKRILCLVALPNGQNLAVEVDKTADGREVLKQVCERIETVESDYFGLKITTSVGESLWINLRNRLTAEVAGSSPYRLELMIKFFVQPQYIHQTSTRQQFYNIIRRDFVQGALHITSKDTIIKLASLLIQSEFFSDSSDCSSISPSESAEACLPHKYRTAANVSKALSMIDRSNDSSSKSQFLREVASLSFYGVHFHNVHDEKFNKNICIGIGPQGMMWVDDKWTIEYSIPYSALQKAVHDNSSVDMYIVQDNGSILKHRISLSKKCSANAFYRDLTEMFSFFHCDTIGSLVAEQFCRDFKGILVSLFNEHTHLGRKYVFDIERTLQEVCDKTQRSLYARQEYRQTLRSRCSTECPSQTKSDDTEQPIDTYGKELSSVEKLECTAVQELQIIRSSLVCKICFDSDINTALVPCGHMDCCIVCAYRLSECPLCKSSIDSVQSIYLPIAKPVHALFELQNNLCV